MGDMSNTAARIANGESVEEALGADRERTQLIIRFPGLTADSAARLERAFAPMVRRMGGRMSAVVTEQHQDYALHKRRRRIV